MAQNRGTPEELIEAGRELGRRLDNDHADDPTFITKIKEMFEELFGIDIDQIPILGDLVEALDTAFGQVLDLFQGLVVTPINSAIAGVKAWFENLLGFRNTTTEAIEVNNEQALDIQNQVVQIQEIFNVVSSRSLADGLDPTGESTFRYEQLVLQGVNGTTADQGFPGHNHGAGSLIVGRPLLTLTSGITIMGFVRQGLLQEKKQATWIAYKVGTVTDFRIAIKLMAPDGAVTQHEYSPTLHNDLVTSPAWMQYKFGLGITPEQGDIIGAEFSMAGSGSVIIAGIELMAPLALPGFRPAQIGAVKPTGTIVSNYSDAQMLTYASGLTPYVQFGSDVGQINAKRSFVDNFNRSAMGPNWILRRLADATDDLKIVSNQVVNPSLQAIETWSDGQWIQPLATDHNAVEQDINSLNTVMPAVLILCGNGGFTEWVMITVMANELKIWTCKGRKASDWTVRGTVTMSSLTAARFKFEFDIATNTYSAWRNGVFIGSWVDSGNVVKHGPGYRYPGFAIDHAYFNSGGKVDNWEAYDV